MRLALALLLVTLASCATRPPKPPDCEGELVPINPPALTSTPGDKDAQRAGP